MWFQDAIVYQIFPDRFFNGDRTNDPEDIVAWQAKPTNNNFYGGDLRGILDKLDYLNDLGINTIYLNPIFQATTNHRYDTIDYYQIDHALGNNDSFREFVEELHQHNIRIILDGVFNHCGNNHPFFIDVVRNGQRSPYADWFEIQEFPVSVNPLSYKTCGGCEYLPKFNFQNPAVRSYLLQAACYWTANFNIDGWRLDSAQRIPQSFWNSFQSEIRKINPQIYLCAELWHEPTNFFQNNLFDGASNYLLRQLLLDYFNEEIIDGEDFLYELSSLYNRLGENAFGMLNLVGCHDTPRVSSVFDDKSQSLFATILVQFCLPGIPQIYYGDEIGLQGGKDPDCRRSMIWEKKQWNTKLQSHFKTMINLRKEFPALVYGNFHPLQSYNHMLAFKRVFHNEEILVIINRGLPTGRIAIRTQSEKKTWEQVFPDKKIIRSNNSEIIFKNLNPFQTMILVGK
jgi:glycosidase